MSDKIYPHQELLEKTQAKALEWCDESDLRFYPKTGEYHVVISQDHKPQLVAALDDLGWRPKWEKKNIRHGWDRIALQHPNTRP